MMRTPLTGFFSILLAISHREPEHQSRGDLKARDNREGPGVTHIGNQDTCQQRPARVADVTDGALHAHSGPQRLELRTIRDKGGR